MAQSIKAFYELKYTEGEEIPRTSKLYTIDCVPEAGPLDILDVGCGTGTNSLALAAKGHRLHGIDISEAAIERYRGQGFDGKAGDLENGLDYPDAGFDLVFCSEVIEHMMSPELLAREMARVLIPGGLLVVSTPNSAFWLYRILGALGYTVSELQHPKHLHFFSKRSLRRLLQEAGLTTVDEFGRNMYALLPPLPRRIEAVLPYLGFRKEARFRTKSSFWQLSHRSRFWNSLFADTLICVMRKRG